LGVLGDLQKSPCPSLDQRQQITAGAAKVAGRMKIPSMLCPNIETSEQVWSKIESHTSKKNWRSNKNLRLSYLALLNFEWVM
jgi:hypothetical protein